MKASIAEGPFFSGALVSNNYDEVRVGLSEEFVPVIGQTIDKWIAHQPNGVPSARITIDSAAIDSVGSNAIVFEKLSEILFSALTGASAPPAEFFRQCLAEAF